MTLPFGCVEEVSGGTRTHWFPQRLLLGFGDMSPKFWTPTRTVVGHVYVLKPRTFCSHPKCEQHCLFGDVNQLFLGFIWYRYQLGTDPYWYQFISHGVASCCTQFNQILLYTQYPSFGHLIAIKHYNDWIVIGFDWSFLISIWYYMYFFTDIHYVFDLYLYIIIIHPREDRICKCHTLNIWGSIFI